jgi:cell division protein FtsZ
MLDAFRVVDDVLLEVARGIIDLLRGPGLINLDFADVRTVLQGAGPTLIGLGRGEGENRALDAARQAIASPLLEASIDGAHGILFNVSGPPDLQLREVRAAADEIRKSADPDAYVIFGASFGRPAGDAVLITLIATGLQWPDGSEVAARTTEPRPAEPDVPKSSSRTPRAATAGGAVNGGGQRAAGARANPKPASPPVKPQAAAKPPPADAPVTATDPAPPASPQVDFEVPSFMRRKPSA